MPRPVISPRAPAPRLSRLPVALAALVVSAALPGPAAAHASEQALVMLLPTDVYVASGTAVVALTALLSFVVPARALERLFAVRTVARPVTRPVTRPGGDGDRGTAPASALVAAAFLALVVVGVVGPPDPLANLLPLTVWTLWWIGVPTLQAVCGDLWRRANPWSAPLRLLTGRSAASPGTTALPAAWRAWPAVLLLLVANAFVLADPAPSDPRRLAAVALGYWAFTLAMLRRYGEREWLARGEAFSMMFSRFAEVAPLRRAGGEVRLGPPGHDLAHRAAPDASVAAAYLVLLACGSFDGLHETFAWLGLLGVNPLEYPGRTAMIGSTLVGLVLLVLGVALIYGVATALGAALARDPHGDGPGPSAGALFRALAPSLLPIAVAYHVAHYLTTFLVDTQYVAVAASDPLGTGRNLFGTAEDRVTTGFFNVPSTVRAIWLTQAGVVVAGHALAVLVAHARALVLFANAPDASRRAVLAHAPLAALMLGYTLFGLWLLASPRGV